ncbi:TetR/AcrR family transcriptional regulator, partial [Bacillus anthracis]|nr:TetR/AcrR family transcriptional regulator [Bacillus anthracis]
MLYYFVWTKGEALLMRKVACANTYINKIKHVIR